MTKKKKIILMIAIILIILTPMVIAIKNWYWRAPYPNYEMPVMPFAYRAENSDVYVFDCNGNIYKISRNSGMTNSFDWLTPTVQCLEVGKTLDWLEKVGTTDLEILQQKYNIFRKIIKNPKFAIYNTRNIIPNDVDHSYTQTTEHWYGYINGTQGKDIYYKGYLEYDVTDERAFWIVNWISDEVRKCK